MTFGREPVAITEGLKELVRSGLNVLILFGVFHMTGEQTAALNVFVGLLVAFVGTLIVRSKVFAPTNVGGDKLEAVKYENQPLTEVKT